MTRNASTLAEILVVLCIVGLALCLFLPRSDADLTSYGLDIIIGVVEVGAVIGCCISTGAFWRRPILVAGAILLCSLFGVFIAWVVMMHGLTFAAIVAVLCFGYILYFSVIRGRRVEQ